MRIKGKQLADTLRDEDAPFSRVYASQLTGGLVFKAKNAGAQAMTVGQAVYISGVSGEVPEVLLADADGAGTMPAAGLIATGGNAGAEVWIISLGELKGVNTSTFSEGDTLYVSTTAGALVASPPAGSSSKLQNIGRVVRADTAGVIFVGGAGRSAATPNLDEGRFFIGNASDQSSTSAYKLPITDGNAGDVLTTDGAGAVTFSAPSGGTSTVLISSSNITHAGSNHAFVTVSPNTNYIIDPSVASVQFVYRIYFTVAATGVDDPASVQIVNLSNLPIRVRSTSANVLYDSLGNAAPYTAHGSGGSGYYFEYNKGTVNLFQSDTTGAGAKWYSYFDYAIENQSVPSEGDGIAYSEADLANINIGQVFGDYVISANVNANAIRAGRRYVTADAETVSRTISLPNVGASESLCDALDGRLMYFENRGTANLRIDPDSTGAPNSGYWNYVSKLDGTSQAGFLDLRPGESIAVRCERVNNNMYYRYIKQGFIPSRITETITATSTISTGTEHHKVVYVNNGATAITVTVPASASLRDAYQLTIKVLGSGAVTVNRSSTDTFDGDTSLTLGQNDQLSLIESASGWAVLHNDAASSGGGGGGGYTYSAITATTTAQASYHYSCDTSGGAFTLNLPALSGVTAGSEIRVKLATAGNDLTIDGNSTETIDGQQTYTMSASKSAITLVASSGTDWEII